MFNTGISFSNLCAFAPLWQKPRTWLRQARVLLSVPQGERLGARDRLRESFAPALSSSPCSSLPGPQSRGIQPLRLKRQRMAVAQQVVDLACGLSPVAGRMAEAERRRSVFGRIRRHLSPRLAAGEAFGVGVDIIERVLQ